MTKKPKFSVRAMSREFDIDRATADKLCSECKTATEARAAIREWLATRPEHKEPDLDPVSGLTWWKSKLKEEVLRLRDGRDRARRLSGGDLIPIAVIEDAFKEIGCAFNRLSDDLCNSGAIDREHVGLVHRLAADARDSFQSRIGVWLARQIERQSGIEISPFRVTNSLPGTILSYLLPPTAKLSDDDRFCNFPAMVHRAQSGDALAVEWCKKSGLYDPNQAPPQSAATQQENEP